MANFSMPWVQKDFDRKTMHLSRLQKNAYRALLQACFENGGVLPDRDAKLAWICELDVRTWRKHREAILAFFYRVPEGWRQTRIDEDLARIAEKRSSAKISGAKGGLQTAIRWHRRR
jgi:uncharacterized protein YdaU (DUF1376 family)